MQCKCCDRKDPIGTSWYLSVTGSIYCGALCFDFAENETKVAQCMRCGLGYPGSKEKCPACSYPNASQFSGRTDIMKEGIRLDDGKPRMDLLPGDVLLSVADVFTKGAEKYDSRNWEKGMAWHKLFSPIERHLWKWWQGEEIDEESGQHHLAHAACDCLMLLASVMREIGEDDRPGKGETK